MAFALKPLEFAADALSCHAEKPTQEGFAVAPKDVKLDAPERITANAQKIQVWTALIAMLILKYLQLKAKFGWSLSDLVALLRMNLFTHRDLWAWIDRPFEEESPPIAERRQLALTPP